MSLIKTMGRGLVNLGIKILRKLDSLKGTPKSIAEGFATGAAVSFTPFVGFHLLIALLVAKIFKQNGVAAGLGTIMGNHWTFPLIWYADFYVGKMVLEKANVSVTINFVAFFKELFHCVIMLDFKTFFSDIYPIFLPMLIGCIPFCIIVWFLLSHTIRQVLKIKISKKGDKSYDTRTGM